MYNPKKNKQINNKRFKRKTAKSQSHDHIHGDHYATAI